MEIKNWHLEKESNISVGDFNNVTDTDKFGAFPGKFGDCAAASTLDAQQKYEQIDFCEIEYNYFYKGNGYFYGLKKDNSEIIAIVTDDNKLIPTFSGAGEFNLKNNTGEEIIKNIS